MPRLSPSRRMSAQQNQLSPNRRNPQNQLSPNRRNPQNQASPSSRRNRSQKLRGTQRAPPPEAASTFTTVIIEKFRQIVNNRGGRGGIRSLGRIFRIMDKNDNHSLSVHELQSALTTYGTPLPLTDCQILLSALDRQGNGSVSYSEFLGAVRGRMKHEREVLVRQAFTVADKDGNGVLDFKDMVSSYNADLHPDVQSGRVHAHAVFDEFLEKWERRGVVDGKVTFEEFLDYYQDISASIDNDQYFELMMRNAWHMMKSSGGSDRKHGSTINTSNLRVLVEFVDGRQEVIAIQHDLGLDKSDKRAIRSALRRQGHHNIYKVRTAF